MPPATGSLRFTVDYLQATPTPQWGSAIGFGLGPVNKDNPQDRPFFVRLGPCPTCQQNVADPGRFNEKEHVPLNFKLEPGVRLAVEATWSSGILSLRVNGQTLREEKIDFIPGVLHFTISGAQARINVISSGK